VDWRRRWSLPALVSLSVRVRRRESAQRLAPPYSDRCLVLLVLDLQVYMLSLHLSAYHIIFQDIK
jgi:hypothetical protein